MCKKDEFTETALNLICKEFGVNENKVLGQKKTIEATRARYAFCVIMSKHSFLSQDDICYKIGIKKQNGIMVNANKSHEASMSNLQYKACFNSVVNQLKEIYK